MSQLFYDFALTVQEHGTIWFVTLVLIVAAVIDGFELKVPNWITYPFVLGGLAFGGMTGGWEGLGWSLVGMMVGLLLLLPAYAIGGMGAGDVKLLAGVGTWVWVNHTVNAFCWSAVIGAVMAVLMVVARRAWKHHHDQFWMILNEILVVKNPEALAAIAAERKPRMMLLPYGIPIAVGTISYFLWMGLLV